VHWPATPRSFKDCPIYLFKAHAASEEFDVLRPMNSKGATMILVMPVKAPSAIAVLQAGSVASSNLSSMEKEREDKLDQFC
jgi:hypothetical protein